MDWGKVGALFTLGCFILAGLTLLFQIMPLPWGRPTKTEAPARPRFSKLMAAFIVFGFVASGLTLWIAWHPIPEFKMVPEGEMEIVEGKRFINEQVEIDGKMFRRCEFVN